MKQIDYLCNNPILIEQVVNYIWDHWKDDYIQLSNLKTKEDMKTYYENASINEYPIVYVMYDDETMKLIGTLTFDIEDMSVMQELKPWMASVFIVPEYRNMGNASELINSAIGNWPLLYLWTYNDRYANFYKRFGFEYYNIIPKHGQYENIIVMKRSI